MSSAVNTQYATRNTDRQSKAAYFILEGLNSYATVQYLYYFYFFTEKQFGFGTKANLCAAALNGGLTAIGSIFGGRFAQKRGYHTSLKVGFTTMMLSLIVGTQVSSAAAHLGVMSVMILGMCFTWASLEALVSEGEPPGRLEKMIGVYNVVWAGAGAVAYFLGGAILQRWLRGIFYVPIAIHATQLAILFWIERSGDSLVPDCTNSTPGKQEPEGGTSQGTSNSARASWSALILQRFRSAGRQPPSSHGIGEFEQKALEDQRTPKPGGSLNEQSAQGNRRPSAPERRRFLRMAWLANPFAYIAINSLVATIPTIALKLGLSPSLAGFTCSTWCFARVAAFLFLWHWPGWHYRFRWMLLAYLSLIAGFVAILLTHSLGWLVATQILFGAATGLIYYSSLFYSMDASETKGEHGGIHEAAIGLGNCAGPAVGAAALQFFPGMAHAAAFAVTACLVGGLGALVWMRRRGERG